MSNFFKGTFRSLRTYNYRVWAGGAIISNIGTWMQRVAQDWLVLTQLTHNNATAVGIVMALQFGPQLLFLPFTGYAADHFNRRKLLIITQSAMGLLALGLGLLTNSNMVQLWHVYIFAFLLGCVTAFDSPARQTFVSELVPESDLFNAVGLNSTSFNIARMIGPAVAGILIAAVGTGWVFLINAFTFVAVIASLNFIRTQELRMGDKTSESPEGLGEGFRYICGRPDLITVLIMLFLIGTFGLNFPIFISTMAVTTFHIGASHYGLLTSCMAIGSVIGALLAARREKPRITILLISSLMFGIGCGFAAIMPNYWFFGFLLIIVGISAQTYTVTSNSTVQLSTQPNMRGRVMAIYFAILMGCTPLGAPIVGWVSDKFGPRWALGIGAASGLLAAIVCICYFVKHRHLRISVSNGKICFSMDADEPILWAKPKAKAVAAMPPIHECVD